MPSGTLLRPPMGQVKADQCCFHIPRVVSGLAGDVPDAGECVGFTAGEESEMTGCLGCPRIERQQGPWPDAAQLPKEESDRDRSPARQVVQESDEGCGVGAAATDPTDVAAVAVTDHLGERLEARGSPEVISCVPTSVE